MRRTGRGDGHAVVLGAGMAGLLAARTLTEAYRTVTIIERDPPRADDRPRRGVPQGRHAHVLLPRGQQIIDGLFPGLDNELIDGGAVVADPGAEHSYTLGGHTLQQAPSPDLAIQASRPFLERVVRERVRRLSGVDFAEGCDVVGLVAPDPEKITGVRIMRRVLGSAAEEIPADLVVDATGRGGRAGAWLERLGHGPVPEERVKVGVAYATRPLRLPPHALADKIVLVGPQPGRPRAMAMVAVEGGRHLLTTAGLDQGHRPPSDPTGLLAYVAGLAPPEVFEAIRAAEPLGDVATYRYPADVRRRYERMRRFPDGLLVIGDALCTFNPIYAQGMTVACIEAQALAGCLAEGTRNLTRRYFRAVAKALNDPWQMAVAANLALPEVEGRRTPAVRLQNAYTERIQAAAARDAAVARQFLRVVGLLDRPTALMHPSIMARALRPAAA
jgi:2-polyprenyl-6-methoxyphenol hydroxylase-like FAD-dependent oxidoreductase